MMRASSVPLLLALSASPAPPGQRRPRRQSRVSSDLRRQLVWNVCVNRLIVLKGQRKFLPIG